MPLESELLDYFDDNMRLLGKASREEIHQKGYWHKTIHCWILRKEAEKNYLLFQKRSLLKKHFPNCYDITAAGHLQSGENPEEGVREIEEEMGISLHFTDLIFLGIRQDVAMIGEEINREFCYTYFLANNQPLSDYHLQKEEVAGLGQIEINEGLQWISDEIDNLPIETYCFHPNDEYEFYREIISKKNLVPHPNSYYLKIFIMAERYFQNKKYLSI